MSFTPMPMPDHDQRRMLADRATQFLIEIRQKVTDHMGQWGCLADPRLTALVGWVNDQLQTETAADVKIGCGNCGAVFSFAAAVISQRPVTGLVCPFCQSRLPGRL